MPVAQRPAVEVRLALALTLTAEPAPLAARAGAVRNSAYC
jgi:hypothetical protein